MTLDVFLRLGRVSNLPTVWSNALAGAVLAGAASPAPVLFVCLALSLFYIGGMWLNDAFDAEIDARERAARPIPNGEIGKVTVFIGGYAMLAAGVAIAAVMGATLAGLCLAAAIILYNWLHKRTVLSPVIMGAARFFSYVFAAAATGSVTFAVVLGAFGLFAHVVGLTYAAKQEAYDQLGNAWPLAVLAIPLLIILWMSGAKLGAVLLLLGLIAVMGFALTRLFRRNKGDVPVAVVTLIAGISLYDAALIAASGSLTLACLAAIGFAATLVLQRIAAGT